MLSARTGKAVRDTVVGLLRLAERGRQGIDLPVCLLDGFRELACLRFACLHLGLEADAPGAQPLNVELQAIDRFGLDTQVGLQILDDRIAIADRRNIRIELHRVQVHVEIRGRRLLRAGILPRRRFEFCGPVLVARD